MPAEQVYLTDKRLDPDRMLFEGVTTDGPKDPHYTVSECAKFFFGRSPHWIRWLEQEHKLILDGADDCLHYETEEVVKPPRKRVTKAPVKGASKKTTSKSATVVKLVAKPKVVKVSWLVKGKCKVCGGKQVGAHKSASGMRVYTLSDIEEMAHALAQNTAISGTQLSNALIALQTEGKIWGKI